MGGRHRIGERHVDRAPRAPGDHAVEGAARDEIDRVHAEDRSHEAVARGRHAAALQVAEHGDPGLGAGCLGDAVADVSADAAVSERAAGLAPGGRLARLGPDRLGDHDEGEVAALALQRLDLFGDPVDPIGNLGDQDHVGAAGDAGVERDVPGVPAHDLEHHHARVAGRGRLQVIKGVGRDLDRGRVTERDLGMAEVVVDGLGDADQVEAALLGQAAQDRQGPVAADADERVQAEHAVALDHLGRAVPAAAVRHGVIEGVALVGGAEDGAADAQQLPGEQVEIERLRLDRAREQPMGALADADHFPAVTLDGAENHGAQHRVEARAVAAAGQDSDPLDLGHGRRPPLGRESLVGRESLGGREDRAVGRES